MAEAMRALTIHQPWAGAVIWFGKSVENRTRRVNYRGPLWVHAGLREPGWDEFPAVSGICQRAGLPSPEWTRDRSVLGAVLGVVQVTGCHHSADCGGEDRQDGRRVPWSCCSPWGLRDRWHIELAKPVPLPEAVPCRGARGLWRLPSEVESAARAQLEVVNRG